VPVLSAWLLRCCSRARTLQSGVCQNRPIGGTRCAACSLEPHRPGPASAARPTSSCTRCRSAPTCPAPDRRTGTLSRSTPRRSPAASGAGASVSRSPANARRNGAQGPGSSFRQLGQRALAVISMPRPCHGLIPLMGTAAAAGSKGPPLAAECPVRENKEYCGEYRSGPRQLHPRYPRRQRQDRSFLNSHPGPMPARRHGQRTVRTPGRAPSPSRDLPSVTRPPRTSPSH
jgi:hypothetical protein